MSVWCEHCRDHYPEDHYENDRHKVGVEYGPTGRDRKLRQIIETSDERSSDETVRLLREVLNTGKERES